MELGISSLGFIIEYGLSNKYEDLADLVLKASEDCLIFAENNNIETVELVLDPPEVIKEEHKTRFINLVNSFSLKKQIHGPFIDVNLCTHNDIISNASVESYLKTIKICREIGVNLLTIHPGLANFLINSIREYNKNKLAQSIQKLLSSMNTSDVRICLENMPKNCHIMLDENDIKNTLSKINRKDLYITYDTSHFYTCDGDINKLWDYFDKIIKNVHIVDNFSKDSDTHPPLGTGKVNFHEIFQVMNNHNYQGPIIIELSTAKDLAQSINFINKFL
ncbi:MAG: sugar phosphate isomerase/epimerase [Candidatus Lokiarchaeota archaeon]|nr:sugar phosphate isomerase/epimerase [Candidatus Lokiarchaeota archaeon]